MALDLDKSIDRTNSLFDRFLNDLQGNILKGHGRGHSVHIFLKLKAGSESKATEWIKNFSERVTSAKQQFDELDDFRKFRIPGELFINLFLTHKCYEFLKVSSSKRPDDSKFAAGMKASKQDLGDPDPKTWDEGYQGEIHISILLAHDDEAELDREARSILREVRGFADIVAGERGKTLRNKNDDTIEHFGYVDGRSQPLFLTEDVEQEPGTGRYDPSAPLKLVLVKDKLGGEHGYGSYLVFRKLEQNVRGFKEVEHKLADQLGLTGDDKELAGAMVVGRFEDGTPVLLQKTDGLTDPIPNNFNFEDDPDGFRCPVHAHIRKVNPRGETVSSTVTEEQERMHRIARRGITYGKRLKEPKDEPELEEMPSRGVGLLFLCFQSDIKEQFEFLQKNFANEKDFLLPGTGIDPVIGQHSDPGEQQWPKTWDSRVKRPFSFHGFVTLKGGEYFFASSISALKNF